MKMKLIYPVLTLLALAGQADAQESNIDKRSYNLGILGGFSEVVRLGVKTLALSEVMSPEEMDAMMDDAAVIAERNEVMMWRETDFLVTDLYPADVADGKHLLLDLHRGYARPIFTDQGR